jgi:pimeloyl-ACP methyl ester carboxylesterase
MQRVGESPHLFELPALAEKSELTPQERAQLQAHDLLVYARVFGRAERRDQDKRFDGVIFGAGGRPYLSGTPLEAVDPILPSNGAPVHDTVVLVNGIMTDAGLELLDAQRLANTGAAVSCVHNATAGMVHDLAQCVADKLDVGDNPAAASVVRLIDEALRAGRSLHLVGHSQGALIISRALGEVCRRLRAEGSDPTAAMKAIKVETFGGAAWTYPDGPEYVHYVNRNDLVPNATGQGPHPLDRPGRGAVVITFSELHSPLGPSTPGSLAWNLARGVDRSSHGPQAIYFAHRVPFALARRGQLDPARFAVEFT